MKNIFFAFLLLAFSGTVNSQWVKQSSLPTGWHLYGVDFKDANTGFAGGINGNFVKTTNGGVTWSPITLFSYNEPINNVFFVDSENGWLVGNSGEAASTNFRTTNGGANWLPMTMPYGSYYHVNFLTPLFGTAIGNGGFAITRNGGVSWNMAPNDIFYVDFFNTQIGVGVSANGIYKTTDGGNTFQSKMTGTGFRNVRFLDQNTVVGTKTGELFRSTNGGDSWNTVANAGNEFSIIKLSSTNAIAYDYLGNTMYTANAGSSWTASATQVSSGIMEIVRVSNTSSAAISAKGDVWLTTNSGQTWAMTLDGLGDLPDTWAIKFKSETIGWVVGQYGFIFNTTDGGRTWNQVTSGGGAQLSDIEMYSDSFGYAIGHNGYVLRTTNGGNFWSTQKLEVTGQVFGRDEGLSKVDIIDSLYAVAAGPGGTVFKTTNAGASWFSIGYPSLPGLFWIEDVEFTDRNTGWLVGRDQDLGHDKPIYKTTDGGSTWSIAFNMAVVFTNIQFIDSQRGWIGGLGNFVLRTTDAGATWQEQTLPGGPYGASPSAMTFTDANTGYAIGWYNYAAKTTNGGVNWVYTGLPTGVTENILGMHVVNANEIWAVGRDGDFKVKIYHTTDGAATWSKEINDPWPYSLSDIYRTPSGNMWAAGYNGRIIKKSIPTGVTGNTGIEPKTFDLMQNYPNPFNPSTTISFNIAENSFVKLSVYDITGKLVSTILNRDMSAGTHKIQFDASALAAGIYLYRLEAQTAADKFVKTNKMMLVK